MNVERAAAEIKLADVQYALARESGFPNWGTLKRSDRASVPPDFSKPGNDGDGLPENFHPWRWCVSYTARPEIIAPLAHGHEYKMFFRVVRRIPETVAFTGYADMYRKVTELADMRVAHLRCGNPGGLLHTRIVAHGWFSNQAMQMATATLTIGASCLRLGDPAPEGERPASADQLLAPGGATPESVVARPDRLPPRIEESYTESDVRDDRDAGTNIFLFSYCEYVATTEGLDYQPIAARAENLTKLHVLNNTPTIIRREWFSVTNPDIVVVHIFVRI
jgi:hypothetical protein